MALPGTGVEGFTAALEALCIPVKVTAQVVLYPIHAVAGPLAGQDVMTGVNVAELAAWPTNPPHWIHLPETLTLSPTNSNRDECEAGYVRHSRQISDWVEASDPIRSWLAHVRGVLTEVVA
jgi:hypothetical protein